MALTKESKNEKLKEFIAQYRELPVLWNTKSKDYFNKDQKAEAYDQLLAFYHANIDKFATLDDVKKKINVLRTNYRREIRKKLFVESIGRSFNPSWAYRELNFLDGYYQLVNKKITSVTPRMKEEFGGQLNMAEEEEIFTEEEILTQEFPSSTFSPEDNITVKHWAHKFARLKPDQKIWADKFINDILTEGELGTLHRHFITTPSTTQSQDRSEFNIENYVKQFVCAKQVPH